MNNKDLPTTKQNAAEDVILIIQEATTKVKEAVIMGRNVQPIIEEYAAMINDTQLRIETYNALVTSARKWEYETRVSIAVFSRGNKQVVNAGFRGFLDNARTGVPVVKDYQTKVRQAIKALSAEPPKIVTTKNGRAYTMSIRNRAEMQVRYETNLKEIEEFKAGGVEYVWLSSHANASPRCAPHQGKLYSINADNKSGKLNGNNYSYLPAVLKLNNGNSILNGYNCRHRAVEYMEGSKPPNDFNAREIKREYAIDQKQRRYENNIRQMKTEEKLLRSTSDSEFIKEANRLRQRRIIAQKQYEIYSLKSGRAYYSWRTQVGREESITPKELLKQKDTYDLFKESEEKLDDFIVKSGLAINSNLGKDNLSEQATRNILFGLKKAKDKGMPTIPNIQYKKFDISFGNEHTLARYDKKTQSLYVSEKLNDVEKYTRDREKSQMLWKLNISKRKMYANNEITSQQERLEKATKSNDKAEIFFASENIRKQKITLNTQRKFVSTKIEDVILHEYGHFIHDIASQQEAIDKNNYKLSSYGFMAKELNLQYNKQKNTFEFNNKNPKTFSFEINNAKISEYATENPMEAFAESFVAYNKKDEETDNFDKVYIPNENEVWVRKAIEKAKQFYKNNLER